VESLALAGLLATGCYSGRDGGLDPEATAGADDGGDGDDAGSDAPVPSEACAAQIALQPLQRLTPRQYRNVVRDLVGDPDLDPAYADDAIVPTQLGVRQLRSGAELVLARREQWGRPVFPCATDGAADDACAETFIADFGRRAFRRPVTAAETDALLGVYHGARMELSFADSMDVVLAAILQSPGFVYRLEEGEAVEGLPDIRRLTDHEIASRLSFFLWDTMPDDELFAAADDGTLQGDGGLRAQVERMLADPRAEAKVQQFVSDWLELDGGQLHFPLEETSKDPVLFPQYDPALADAMRTELEALVHRVFFEEDASFERLLMDRTAYVNGPLAELYGVTGPMDADTWDWVQLPEDQRAGLLTRAAFLAVYGSAKAQSPIRRGVFVLEQMQCIALGDPPPNASDIPVDGGEGEDDDGNAVLRSVREDVIARTMVEGCAACHGIINPTGFAFEHYDAIGQWQDVEVGSGKTIDSSGELVGDSAGSVADGLELSAKLASSPDVRACFAERWVTRAIGNVEGDPDECLQRDVIDNFAQTGDMRELLVSMVLSNAFRFVRTGEAQ
jgi:hypothetical protein